MDARLAGLALASLVLLAGCSASAPPPQRPHHRVQRQLSYLLDDEFSGKTDSPPGRDWHYNLGSTGYGPSQLQDYTRFSAYQDGHGHLVIAVTRAGGSYYSARLVSDASFTEGDTLAARIRLPAQVGFWPAWWLLGDHWPAGGEVDMVEDYGNATVQTTVHTPSGPETMYSMAAQLSGSAGWHTWEVAWTAAGFTFSRDGQAYLTVTPGEMRNWGYNSGAAMHMVLNVAVGGIAGTPSPSAKFPVTMEVDWVRAWRGNQK
jgi:beta-glucanase (GH16 family)